MYMTCPHCGKAIEDKSGIEYRHSLSAGLVKCLRRLWDLGGGPLKLRQLGLTYSEESNFQKNRYWGFVAKADPTNKRGGRWLITPNGVLFLTGKYSVGKYAFSRNGYVQHRKGPMVTIHQVERANEYFLDYSEYAAKTAAESRLQTRMAL